MPNPDYSYQGWNPGQGMSDFAQTMRQGYLDQQALKQRQFENLISAHHEEAENGPLTGQAFVPQQFLDTTNVQQGEQQAADVATANRRGSYVVNPTTNTVQEIGGQGSAPASSSAPSQPAQSNSQPGSPGAPPPPLDPSKFDKDENGNLVDKSGNPVDPHVVAAAQHLGGHVDENTGGVMVPSYIAKQLGQQYSKNQSALATIGAAAFRGGLVNAPQVHVLPQPRAASSGAAAKDPLDAAYKADPVLQGYYRTLSSNAAMTLTPDQRNNYFNLIQQRQQQIQQHFSGGTGSSSAPAKAPASQAPQGDVQGPPVQKLYNPKTNMTRFVYKDGSHQDVNGRQ